MEVKELVNKKSIILFGATDNHITRYIINKLENVKGFIDNNESKWGTLLFGKPIQSVVSMAESLDDSVIIIATYAHWEEMSAQLERMNVKNYMIAMRDIEDFTTVQFQAFCNGINLDNPVIDTLHLELSGYCNCKCVYCLFHGVPNKKESYRALMTWDILEEIVEKMKVVPTITTLNVVGGGEIFLHPEWFEMMSYVVRELPIKKIIMYTNGMLLNEDIGRKIMNFAVEEIRLEVSIDGRTPEENDCYRKGSVYEVVKKNILRVRELFSTDDRIRLVITNCYPEVIDKERLLRNRNIITHDLEVPSFIKRDFPDITAVSKRTLGQAGYMIPGFELVEVEWPAENNLCLDLFHVMAIDAMGKLLRCSCWEAGVMEIADIFKDDLIDIWYTDEQLQLARGHFLERNPDKDFCANCPARGMGKYHILVEK